MNNVKQIAACLDRELRTDRFTDASNNGLQVENSGRVGRVCCGVDGSIEFFEAAARRGAGLLIVHHGISWKDSLKTITDLNYRRIAFLMQRDLALYACHLPLDAHPRLGNNARMARALGLRQCRPFAPYGGRAIGLRGVLPRPLALEAFARRVEKTVANRARVFAFGKKTVRTVAMVVGGGAVGLDEAGRADIDVYLSGEPGLGARNALQEWRMNGVFAGHYATESLGPRALASFVRRRFGVPAEFLDLRIEV